MGPYKCSIWVFCQLPLEKAEETGEQPLTALKPMCSLCPPPRRYPERVGRGGGMLPCSV